MRRTTHAALGPPKDGRGGRKGGCDDAIGYKSQTAFVERRDTAARVMRKYPDRVPVVVERKAGDKSDTPSVAQQKYLVPRETTMGEFVYIIRRRIRLSPTQAIFVFANNRLPPVSMSMSEVYEEYRDPDGILYLVYSGENTFGGTAHV